MTKRPCKDCVREGVGTNRPAPHPGPRCTTHHRAVRKVRRAAAKDRRVVNTYGLAPGDWDKLFEAQQGKCAICRRYRAKAVDHDHKCCPGKTSCGTCVRGLLCGTCNTILGWWRDVVDVFLRAAEYLRNPPAREVLRGTEETRPADV